MIKNDPIHTISYELHQYMPCNILFLLIQFTLILLFCSLSNGFWGLLLWSSPYYFCYFHSHACLARILFLLGLFLARIAARQHRASRGGKQCNWTTTITRTIGLLGQHGTSKSGTHDSTCDNWCHDWGNRLINEEDEPTGGKYSADG